MKDALPPQTVHEAAKKAIKATNFCTKHGLYHGQKYKSCTPQERVLVEVAPRTEQKIDELAKRLHAWYIEATGQLDPKNFNPDAQKPYDKLRPEQQDIDRYIAGQVQALLTTNYRELLERLLIDEKYIPQLTDKWWREHLEDILRKLGET